MPLTQNVRCNYWSMPYHLRWFKQAVLLSRPFGYSLSFFYWSVIPNPAVQWHYENIYSRYMMTLYNYNILLSALFTKVKCDPSECLKEKSWKYTLSSELKESLTDVVLIGSIHLCGGITLGIWLKTGLNVWYYEDGLLINFPVFVHVLLYIAIYTTQIFQLSFLSNIPLCTKCLVLPFVFLIEEYVILSMEIFVYWTPIPKGIFLTILIQTIPHRRINAYRHQLDKHG